jgi:prepilin-type N-terminal cleavage/methylation domain-containing protein
MKKLKNGFTLIEIMVAIFILTLGVLAVLAMFPYGLRIMNASNMSTKAVELAQGKIEEVISISYQSINISDTIENSLPSPFEAFKRETIITYVDPSSGLSQTDSDKGVKKIRVIVFWKSGLVLSQKNIEVSTLISQR